MKKKILIVALAVVGVFGVKATQYITCSQPEWENCGGECGWNTPTGPATMTCQTTNYDGCQCENVS